MNSKTLRFDEDNIRHTNHPQDKDYGLMSIPESKTPYPRHADPVEANELRRRLQEALQRANMMMHEDNNDDAMAEDSGQRVSKEAELRDKQRAEFLRKRQQFYQSEFLIAKQKNMSTEVHPPGPSVGNNWRIDEVDERPHSPSLTSTNARIASIISRHRLPNPGSLVNQEALREIADQITRTSQSRN